METRHAVTDVVTITTNPRSGLPQIDPDVKDGVVYLHPIPKDFAGKVSIGERWTGYFGVSHRPIGPGGMGKKDVQGRSIYVRYFIPVERLLRANEN